MKEKKIIYFIVAEENTDRILKSNKILIDELLKKFEHVYFLNMYNLKLFTKKKVFSTNQLNDKIIVINFKDAKNFKEFISNKKILALVFLGKDPTDFYINYLINRKNIKLIMIMNLSQIGNKMTIDFNVKYFFSAYKIFIT